MYVSSPVVYLRTRLWTLPPPPTLSFWLCDSFSERRTRTHSYAVFRGCVHSFLGAIWVSSSWFSPESKSNTSFRGIYVSFPSGTLGTLVPPIPPFLPSLSPSGTLSSTRDSLTIPPLFKVVFTWSLKTCLHHVYKHVYTMFTDMFTPCLQICLHIILRNF